MEKSYLNKYLIGLTAVLIVVLSSCSDHETERELELWLDVVNLELDQDLNTDANTIYKDSIFSDDLEVFKNLNKRISETFELDELRDLSLRFKDELQPIINKYELEVDMVYVENGSSSVLLKSRLQGCLKETYRQFRYRNKPACQ